MMKRTVTVIFDGEVLRPEQPIDLEPNVRYHVTIEDQSMPSQIPGEPGILDDIVAFAQDLGVDDLAENLDHYLYGLPKR